jgi:hypothetical protein
MKRVGLVPSTGLTRRSPSEIDECCSEWQIRCVRVSLPLPKINFARGLMYLLVESRYFRLFDLSEVKTQVGGH